MGVVGLIILVVIAIFILVTVIGWDGFYELADQTKDEFKDFVVEGVDEAKERLP